MSVSNKYLALKLLEDVIYYQSFDEKELERLRRVENKDHKTVGESPVRFHLKVLQELVDNIKEI